MHEPQRDAPVRYLLPGGPRILLHSAPRRRWATLTAYLIQATCWYLTCRGLTGGDEGVESGGAVETTNWDIAARNLDGSSQVRPGSSFLAAVDSVPATAGGEPSVTIEVGHTVAGTPVGL